VAFVPGDCVALFHRDEAASRPYSIASGVNEDELRFLIRRLPAGTVSADLARRVPGDRIRMSPPFGWFRPGQVGDFASAAFVATGTGIAPFLSYLRSFPAQPPRICLYGVRRQADAVAADWVAQRCPLKLAVSRERVPSAHHGRVTDLLEALPLEPLLHYYLCGLDTMLTEVSDWLTARGVTADRIHRECFFNA